MKRIFLLMLILLAFSTACTRISDLPKNDTVQVSDTEKTQEELMNQAESNLLEDATELTKSKIEELTQKNDEISLALRESALVIKAKDILIEDLNLQLETLSETEVNSLGPTPGNPLIVEAVNVLQALDLNDAATLSLYVSPITGLRLSPYQYVNLSTDIVLTQTDVNNLFALPSTYFWGTQDGSGDPINLTAANYYASYVYDENYLVAPMIGQNTVLSMGNMINNITAIYPAASFVEFYFPGFNPIYGGADWKSLTLIMENQGGSWILIGIVHGQWTI